MANLLYRSEKLAETAEAFEDNYHESEMETRTRQVRGFNEVESELPDIRPSNAGDERPSITNGALPDLGTHKSHSHDVSDNDIIWLFDNTAFRSVKTNKWEAEFVAAGFDKNTGLEVSTVVADIAEKVGIGRGDAAEATIRQRLLPFMESVLPRRVVHVDFGQEKELKLGPTSRDGISSNVKPLPKHGDGDVIPSFAKVPEKTEGILRMKTVFAEPDGWGVISGIKLQY